MKTLMLGLALLTSISTFGDDCTSPGPQEQMVRCAFESSEKAIVKLEEANLNYLNDDEIDQASKERLKISHESWLVYSKNQCSLEANIFDGGRSMVGVSLALCMKELAEIQTERMNNMLKRF